LHDQGFGWTKTHYKARPLSKYWVQTSLTADGPTDELKERVVKLFNKFADLISA